MGEAVMSLYIGPAVPIPVGKDVIDALVSCKVTASTAGPSVFQLAVLGRNCAFALSLLDHPRVVIVVDDGTGGASGFSGLHTLLEPNGAAGTPVNGTRAGRGPGGAIGANPP